MRRLIIVALVLIAAVSLLPLVLGFIATMMGNAAVDSVIATAGQVNPADVEQGRQIAMRATHLGLGVSAFLLVLCGIAFVVKRIQWHAGRASGDGA